MTPSAVGILKHLEPTLQKLRDPIRIRVTALSILGILALAIYWPLSTQIEAMNGDLQRRSGKNAVVSDLITVQGALEKISTFCPRDQVDVTWWLGRLRAGAREFHVDLGQLTYVDSDAKGVAGFSVLNLSIEFTCTFKNSLAFVGWIEAMTPRVRIDALGLDAGKAAKGKVLGRLNLQALVTVGVAK